MAGKALFISYVNITSMTKVILLHGDRCPAFRRGFREMVGHSMGLIQSHGLVMPDINVVVSLTPMLGTIPMHEPTALSTPDREPSLDNSLTDKLIEWLLPSGRTQWIYISSKALGKGFMGLTEPGKVLTHEMVHTVMRVLSPVYGGTPEWAREGMALYIAGQDLSEFDRVPFSLRNDRWARYRSHYLRFAREVERVGMDGIMRNIFRVYGP